ncbi:MAG TPA: hypothetical protein DEB06_01015 [Phycisphaerales bacterium]|nr:hypothetical protein [Phycisphaerales bacterium]
MQKTCCQRAEILVTRGDIERIEAHTARDDFWSRRAPANAAYSEPDPDDPDWRSLTLAPDGTRRTLNRRSNGDCTFLGQRGCVLPTEVRPLVCRLYPYGYTERGLEGIDDEYCPTAALVPRGQPGATMLTVLDMSRADAERWRGTLYDELRADAKAPSCISV